MIENIPVIKHIIELLSAIWSLIGKLFGAKVKSEAQIDIPKKTIIVTPTPGPFTTWWHMGSWSGSPAMQVVGDFKVTNITKYTIFLCAAKMKKTKLLGHVTTGGGSNEIPSRCVTDLRFHFFVFPPFKKEGETFTTDIAIIDQFGNKHWINRINFVYR
jgi:hypothetical protein